jgi:capsular polysaccharide biosynthesis protein
MENEEYETIDLLEVLNILRQHLVVLILCTAAAAAVGFGVSKFLMTPQYRASAMMIVNTRQDVNASVTSDQITSATKLVSTYSIIIKSDTVLQQVINDLGLNMTYAELNAKVSVDAVDSTQVMKISVTDRDPAWAQQVCAHITDVAPNIIVDKVEAGSVKVISQSTAGTDPVSPSVPKNTAIAGLIGLVLCLGVVFLRAMLDNKIKDENDIKKYLDLTVIGVIPEYEEGGKR